MEDFSLSVVGYETFSFIYWVRFLLFFSTHLSSPPLAYFFFIILKGFIYLTVQAGRAARRGGSGLPDEQGA